MRRQTIKVRADFDVDGKPIPLKFRYVTEEEELTTVKVDKITSRDTNNFAGNRMHIFKCETIENGIARTYELRYEMDTCRWFIYV